MIRKIEKILDEQIRPALASHGGNVELVDIDNYTVYIRMNGGCHGCSSATETVKKGIDSAIRKALPEIKEILDISDHESGENPYM